METYDGFCGFRTIKEFHKLYPEQYSVENLYDLFEIKEIKKNGRRCVSCKKLVKFDDEGNKAKFYSFYLSSTLVGLSQSLCYLDGVELCSKDCITSFLENELGNLEEFIKNYNIENEEFVKEAVDGIIKSANKHGVNPYK